MRVIISATPGDAVTNSICINYRGDKVLYLNINMRGAVQSVEKSSLLGGDVPLRTLRIQ